MPTEADRALEIVREEGLVRSETLVRRGIHRATLTRLVRRGLLERVARGVYATPDALVTAEHEFAQVARRVPNAVICLISALRLHDLTTQLPREIWLAVERGQRAPSLHHPRLRVFRFSGAAFHAGIEVQMIEGVPVRIYTPAKTVADCFKHRNTVGLDVALEALRDCLEQRKCRIDDLWRYAKIDRVTNVIRPYLEALTQ